MNFFHDECKFTINFKIFIHDECKFIVNKTFEIFCEFTFIMNKIYGAVNYVECKCTVLHYNPPQAYYFL